MVEQHVKGFDEYLAILRRRKTLLILPAALIFVAGTVVAFTLPPVYRAQAIILIERQEIPQDMVQSTVTTYAAQRIQLISRRVMTSENLSTIVDKFDLYREWRESDGLAPVLDSMRSSIRLDMLSADVIDPRTNRSGEATIAFSVSFQDRSPVVVQQVTSELVSLYIGENRKSRSEAILDTSNFFRQEAERVGAEVSSLEFRLAAFKEKNADTLPERVSANLGNKERTEQRVRDNEQEIRKLKERTIYLESELAQLSPNALIYSAEGKRIMGPEDRYRVLEAEYVAKAARYSGDHPDLGKLRREMEALQASVGGGYDTTEIQAQLNRLHVELSSAEGRYAADHPTVKSLRQRIAGLERELSRVPVPRAKLRSSSRPNNPAYIELQTRLRVAGIEMESLQRIQENLKRNLEKDEARARAAPAVERELLQLTRDYQNQLSAYRELKTKQMQAAMAESLEQGQRGERLTVVEAPELPSSPESPNRKAVLFISLVLSIAGGIGSVTVREVLDNSMHNASDVAGLLGAPPLSVVPYIDTKADERKRAWIRFGTAVLVVGIVSAGLAFIHQRVAPLEEAWTSILERVGVDTE